jgi:hypothetical protein
LQPRFGQVAAGSPQGGQDQLGILVGVRQPAGLGLLDALGEVVAVSTEFKWHRLRLGLGWWRSVLV